MLTDVENKWSRELQSDVEILPTETGMYAVYVDRSYWAEYATLPLVEDALGKMWMLQEVNGDGY